MAGNFKKEDLRVIKTQKSFQNAMGFLLEHRKFKQLTVNDLCEEALASRATFYTHYRDKYDLLENWFCSFAIGLKGASIENIIEKIFNNKTKVMQNILYEADLETIEIVHNFIRSLIDSYIGVSDYKDSSPEYNILSDFYVGGFVEIIKWQGKQKKQQDTQSAQNYFVNLIKTILEFHIKHNEGSDK